MNWFNIALQILWTLGAVYALGVLIMAAVTRYGRQKLLTFKGFDPAFREHLENDHLFDVYVLHSAIFWIPGLIGGVYYGVKAGNMLERERRYLERRAGIKAVKPDNEKAT